MASPPIIEWRLIATNYPVVTSQALTGSGANSSIPAGSTSNIVTLAVFNNFGGAAVADALNCTLASYDDAIHQGVAVTPQTTGHYLQVQIQNYNGNPAGRDTAFYGIGGSTKHAMPMNGGILPGGGNNFITVAFCIVLPISATQGAVSQGLWFEYSSSA